MAAKTRPKRDKPAHILKHFGYAEQPLVLHDIGALFYNIADELDSVLPECAEKSSGLRKLLEARDCMFRAKKEAFD